MTANEIECIEEGGTEPTIALLRRLAAALDVDVRLIAGHRPRLLVIRTTGSLSLSATQRHTRTTVAVFRRVTALPLGVMLCAPEVVTLRHLLSGRGLLPGSGYGEEPGAVVVPAGDGLVPPSLDGPVQREGEAGAGDQPGGVLPGETGEPGGLAGRQPDGGDAGRAGQAGRRGPGRARHRGESAGPRRSRTSAARTRRPARPHQPGSPRRTAGAPGRHTGCSPRRKARPSRPSCGAPRCGRTPRRTPPTSRAARPRSAGPAASSRAAAWWRNPGHRGSGWVVPARSFYGGGGPAPRCFCLRVRGALRALYGPVGGCPPDRRRGGPGARTYSGQRARRDHHAASFAQVRSRVEVQAGEYCKTVGSAYVGSNPTPATHGKDAPHLQKLWCGASLWVSGHVRL